MFLDVINNLMEKRKINKSTLARESGIPYTTIDGWYKKGYKNVGLATLKKLSDYFNVSLDFLITGESKQNVYYSQKAHNIARIYDSLDSHGKNIIDLIVQEEAQRAETYGSRTRFISLFTLPVSAGNGVYLEGYASEPIEIKNTPSAAKSDYALLVSGDSMSPEIMDGDIILVHTTPSLNDGEIGVFIHDGQGYIKRKKGSLLVSDNKKYPPILAGENTIIKGHVVGKAQLI